MNLWDDIKYQFIKSSVSVRRIIAWNVLMYLLLAVPVVLLFLSGHDTAVLNPFLRWLQLPADLSRLMWQPWSLVSYMFLHDGLFHLLFNMLWLYWIGSILHEYLGNRYVYETYFAGGILGGLLYVICYNVFPVFASGLNNSYAVGASAGVLAVVVATATLLPDYGLQLLFFGNVRLKYLALVSVLIDVISIPQHNPGGHIAHLGGALFGFFYIRYIYRKGHLIPDRWLQVFQKKSKLRVYHRNPTSVLSAPHKPSQEDIDRILDKISRSGYDSLSKKEKDILFKASNE